MFKPFLHDLGESLAEQQSEGQLSDLILTFAPESSKSLFLAGSTGTEIKR